jgi:hypothetical protein
MVCVPIKGEGFTGFMCFRGLRKPPWETCSEKGCNQPADYLCDHPIKPRRRKGKLQTTCDRKLCAEHRTAVNEGVDHCPFHAEKASRRQSDVTSRDSVDNG